MAVPPTTAREATFRAALDALLDGGGEVYAPVLEELADAVIGVLGISALTTRDDVVAAILLWQNDGWSVSKNTAGSGWTAWASYSYGPVVMADTKAAAVLALNAALEVTT